MDQFYFVNHFYPFDSYGVGREDGKMIVAVNRAGREKIIAVTLERYLNKNHDATAVAKVKDPALFNPLIPGGIGMLIRGQ